MTSKFKKRFVLVLFSASLCLSSRTCMADVTAVDQRNGDLGQQLINQADIDRGLCVVIGDGDLAIELAQGSELLVHVRHPNEETVHELRGKAENAGLGIDRLVIEQGDLHRLPYADSMIDIVIMTQAENATLQQLPASEVLRVLRPEGVAIVGNTREAPANFEDTLSTWAAVEQAEGARAFKDAFGSWITFRKATPRGVDEWTHWEKAPDNNPVSADSVIQAPYMTQFMSGPYYIGMPSITTAAGGRTFLAIGHIAHHRREWDLLNKLIARNGYNGTVLWERSLPDGYLVHRSAFVANEDTFYMIDGDSCLMLNPETGEEKGRISVPGLHGDWKWMAKQGDILYALAGKPEPKAETTKGDRTFGGWSWADLSKGYYGKRIPFGFGDVLAAYDLKEKRTLWTHKEESLIDSRGMSMSRGKTFLYCPDRHLRALDSATGQIVWTNADTAVLGLIEQPGRGLRSTPGFRTACMNVAAPQALIIQGQTRMNVIGVSTEDGRLLWQKPKITNNPNAIYVDGQIVLGVGPGGSHVAINPVTGDVSEDLNFRKVACTRLTASGDSFFCRGEGTLRFDRESKKVLVDGGVRPGCNDGAIPAHGMLYIGPWQCDCNLSLVGQITKCSAGDFRFNQVATEAERLTRAAGDDEVLAPLEVSDKDWPTLRGNNARSAGTPAEVVTSAQQRWMASANHQYTPTAPVSAGGLVFTAGSDGGVRAIDGETGEVRWRYSTNFPIKQAPTIWEGRLYFGSADGHVYCLEAATGRRLWRFRAAPADRYIMVYRALSSTWPVHSGVLVQDGTAYVAAGIIDQDGTHVYALDARTGAIQWQNNTSGHLDEELRKGVSAQGNLSISDGHLLLAGGNQVSPARFDLETGECLTESLAHGRPKANNGQFVGVFRDVGVINGGRILHAAPENVSTKGFFAATTDKNRFRMNNGGIPPAWNDNQMALVNFKHGKLTCLDSDKVAHRMREGFRVNDQPRGDRPGGNPFYALVTALQQDGAVLWQTDLGQPNKFEVVSLAVCPNAIVAVVAHQVRFRAQRQWFAVALDVQDGRPLWRHELRGKPLPGGLLVDAAGQVVITMLEGDILCLGAS